MHFLNPDYESVDLAKICLLAVIRLITNISSKHRGDGQSQTIIKLEFSNSFQEYVYLVQGQDSVKSWTVSF